MTDAATESRPLTAGTRTASTAGRPAERAAAESRSGRPEAVGKGAELLRLVLVAAIPTAVYFVVVLRTMTYAWDDFVQFGVTNQSGIGRQLLTYDLFEHFGPANRLTHGLLLTLGGLDPRFGIAVAVVIFFAYCLSLVDLARVLGATWPTVALGLAVATVTPATVFIAGFFDPFFHVMVPVAATAAATAAYVRWVRTGRRRYALAGSGLVFAACAVQERGSFVVLFLALARVLVIDHGVPVRRWLPTLVRDWRFLLVPALISAADAVIVALYYASDATRGGLPGTALFVAQAWGQRLVPMVTGTYGLGSGGVHEALVVAANLLVLALAAWTVRRRHWNARPWLLLLGWFVFAMAFVGFGRLGLVPRAGLLGDPNYYSYALPAVVVVVATTLSPAARQPDSTSARRTRAWGAAQLVAAAALAALILVSVMPWASRSTALAPGYLTASVSALHAQNDIRPVAVSPTRVPNALVPGGWFPFNSGELYLKEADPRTVVDVDPNHPEFLDVTGKLTPATGHLVARLEPDETDHPFSMSNGTGGLAGDSYCLTAGGTGRFSAPLAQPVDTPGGAAWIKIIGHGSGATGSPATGDGQTWAMAAHGQLTRAGGSVSYLVPSSRISEVDLVDLQASRMCIDAIEIWTLTARDGQGACSWVGPDGELTPSPAAGPEARCR